MNYLLDESYIFWKQISYDCYAVLAIRSFKKNNNLPTKILKFYRPFNIMYDLINKYFNID